MNTYTVSKNMNNMGAAYMNPAYAGQHTFNQHAAGENVKAVKKHSKAKSTSSFFNILFLFVVLAVFMFVPVTLNSTITSIQAENNEIQAENDYIQAEINSIEGQLVEVTKVTKIEKIATHKYGMVYPSSTNCITMNEDKPTGKNLASTIKEEAYN